MKIDAEALVEDLNVQLRQLPDRPILSSGKALIIDTWGTEKYGPFREQIHAHLRGVKVQDATKKENLKKCFMHLASHQEGQWTADYIMNHLFENQMSLGLMKHYNISRILTFASGTSKTHCSKFKVTLQDKIFRAPSTSPWYVRWKKTVGTTLLGGLAIGAYFGGVQIPFLSSGKTTVTSGGSAGNKHQQGKTNLDKEGKTIDTDGMFSSALKTVSDLSTTQKVLGGLGLAGAVAAPFVIKKAISKKETATNKPQTASSGWFGSSSNKTDRAEGTKRDSKSSGPGFGTIAIVVLVVAGLGAAVFFMMPASEEDDLNNAENMV